MRPAADLVGDLAGDQQQQALLDRLDAEVRTLGDLRARIEEASTA